MNDEEKARWLVKNHECRAEVLSLVNNIDGFITLQMAERFSFTREQSQKFHRIFFDAARVSFNAKIEIYKAFLREYEPGLLENECSELPSLLDEVKSKRNVFAHSSDPMVIELEHKELSNMPFVKVYRLRNGENVAEEFTELQYRELYNKIMRARHMMVLILTKIMNARRKTAEDVAQIIKDENLEISEDNTRQDSEQ